MTLAPANTVTYRAADPERMAGSMPVYSSFADFMTQCKIDNADPNRIGTGDILDILNPLQHIPLVGSLYRHATGDTIKPGAMLMGGAMFGGGAGLMAASVNVAVQDKTGADMGETVLARLDSPTHQDQAPELPVMLAAQDKIIQGSNGVYALSVPTDLSLTQDPPPIKDPSPAPRHMAYFAPDRTAGGVVAYV